MTWQVEAQGTQVRAVAPSGVAIGQASAAAELHGQPLAPGHLFVHLAVEEAYRRQGVGAALYRALLGRTGGAVLECAVAAGDEASSMLLPLPRAGPGVCRSLWTGQGARLASW